MATEGDQRICETTCLDIVGGRAGPGGFGDAVAGTLDGKCAANGADQARRGEARQARLCVRACLWLAQIPGPLRVPDKGVSSNKKYEGIADRRKRGLMAIDASCWHRLRSRFCWGTGVWTVRGCKGPFASLPAVLGLGLKYSNRLGTACLVRYWNQDLQGSNDDVVYGWSVATSCSNSGEGTGVTSSTQNSGNLQGWGPTALPRRGYSRSRPSDAACCKSTRYNNNK